MSGSGVMHRRYFAEASILILFIEAGHDEKGNFYQ
jgi:hypothetical protein